MKDDNIVGWFSLENGQHVPLREGESKREATSKFLNKKMSRVQKNKDKYNKIDNFKRKKQSNKLKEQNDKEIKHLDNKQEEEFDKKIIRLEKVGNQYIPVREGEDINGNNVYEKNLDEEREKFYETYAKFYDVEKRTNGNVYYAKLTSGELNEELENVLDKKIEENGRITKDDVKSVIENFKKRKASNVKQMPQFEGTEKEKLRQEKDYIESQIKDLESGNVFVVRDNPANQDNYLLRRKNYMNLKDRTRYEKLEERKAEIERLLSK